MHLVTVILSVLVGLEFVFIFYLETIATSSKKTAETFGMDQKALRGKELGNALKNQGVYNLGLAVLIQVAVFAIGSRAMLASLMIYIIAVAAYGSLTVSRSIIWKQGGLAMLTLVSLLVFG